jgi:hypothetical protein
MLLENQSEKKNPIKSFHKPFAMLIHSTTTFIIQLLDDMASKKEEKSYKIGEGNFDIIDELIKQSHQHRCCRMICFCIRNEMKHKTRKIMLLLLLLFILFYVETD